MTCDTAEDRSVGAKSVESQASHVGDGILRVMLRNEYCSFHSNMKL